MALIICDECGKEYSDRADACPNCGNPNTKKETVNVEIKKEKGTWSTGKLVIGILSIVLFVFIAMQSCAVGLGNAVLDSKDSSGTSGLFCSIMLLVAGIVGVATRNSSKSGGSIACAILYCFGWMIGSVGSKSFGDLEIWGGICFWFAIVHIVSIVIAKRKAKKNQ